MSLIDHPILLQVRLTGLDISPGKVRSKDIAEIIRAMEEMIGTYVTKKHPEISIDDVVIGLQKVEKGSLVLEFAPSLEGFSIPAIEEIAKSIETHSIEQLPNQTRRNLREIRHVAVKRKLNAEIYIQNGSSKYLTSINSSLEIPQSFSLKGETTIYGEIIRVGGKEPRVMVKTISGDTLYCDAKISIARQAGQRLYTIAGLSGIAEWDIETMEIQKFTILGFTDYEDIPLQKAFCVLSEEFGEDFDKIKNPEKFVAQLRSEG